MVYANDTFRLYNKVTLLVSPCCFSKVQTINLFLHAISLLCIWFILDIICNMVLVLQYRSRSIFKKCVLVKFLQVLSVCCINLCPTLFWLEPNQKCSSGNGRLGEMYLYFALENSRVHLRILSKSHHYLAFIHNRKIIGVNLMWCFKMEDSYRITINFIESKFSIEGFHVSAISLIITH